MEICHGRGTPFGSERHTWLATEESNLCRCVRRLSFQSHSGRWRSLLRQRRRNLYSLDTNSGELRWKFKTGDVVHASPAVVNGVAFFGSWAVIFTRLMLGTEKRGGATMPARIHSFTIRSVSNPRPQ